ncbi:putative zinc metalloprotease Rip3 [Oxobacter pfennigii]|uniref:Putative zinc metalloprotease Rip3 n=1 Tax=Oxobacter pfennigii TaxID=36849 RepID=A0A0P8YWR8_9CLOT|nr:M50 family metallopeptidase [Oxobacter pfennigii]KPU44170.1 putative zinc metalloprotease Rip3 [Oxobacter pfennigii]
MGYFKKLISKIKLNKYFGALIILCAFTGFLKEMALLFFFVTFHELLHCITAIAFGLRVESIELFPFGGVAKIDNLEGARAYKEIITACAGPAGNAAIAMIFLILDKYGVKIPDYNYIMDINISLALFNLLPGLPLDGGRMLRASMKYFIGFRKATRTAVMAGKIIAVLLFLTGFISYFFTDLNLSLILVPFFVYFSAENEEKSIMYTIMKDVVSKNLHITDSGIMEAYVLCVYEDTRVREILKHFDLHKYHIIFLINRDYEIQALLTEAQIMEGLQSHEGDITIKQLYIEGAFKD